MSENNDIGTDPREGRRQNETCWGFCKKPGLMRRFQSSQGHKTSSIRNSFAAGMDLSQWGDLSSTRSSLFPSCDQLCRDSHVSCFSYFRCPIVLRPYSTVGAWWIGTHYGKHLLRKGSPGGSCLARWTDRNQRAQSNTRQIKSRAVLQEVWPCFIY